MHCFLRGCIDSIKSYAFMPLPRDSNDAQENIQASKPNQVHIHKSYGLNRDLQNMQMRSHKSINDIKCKAKVNKRRQNRRVFKSQDATTIEVIASAINNTFETKQEDISFDGTDFKSQLQANKLSLDNICAYIPQKSIKFIISHLPIPLFPSYYHAAFLK